MANIEAKLSDFEAFTREVAKFYIGLGEGHLDDLPEKAAELLTKYHVPRFLKAHLQIILQKSLDKHESDA